MIDAPSMRRCAGLTLVELLLTLAATAMISTAIAAMLVAVSYGTESGKDMRSLVVKNKIISARLTASVRSARMILERGNNHIVLWLHDDNQSTTPNLGEIQYIAFDAANTRINAYTADWTGMTPAQIDAANTDFALTTDFQTATAGDRGQSHFPAVVWLNDTAAWNVTVNHADTQQATLVSYQLTLTQQQMSDIVIGAAALRNAQ